MSISQIPVVDPAAQNRVLEKELWQAIEDVQRSGSYILARQVEELESEFANYIGTTSAIGVASGTDAISIALRAMGIGTNDEVITVSHTAIATVAAIEAIGAIPVLVDVEPDHLTLDAEQLKAVLTGQTKAIVAVHLYGQVADLDGIQEFCREHGLYLLEDASQAHGARYRKQMIGSFGDAAAFSCYPTKNLGALGDAGLITTSSDQLAERMRRIRQYGWSERNWSTEPGINSRLDEMQAAVLRVKLKYLDDWIARRREVAALYSRAFGAAGMWTPSARDLSEHAFHLYVVRSRNRHLVRAHLLNDGVQTAIHYPYAIHQQPGYHGRIRTAKKMNETEMAAATVLSLPMFPELSDEDCERVIASVLSAPIENVA